MGLPFCLRWSRKAALLRGRLSGDQKEEENHCRWKEQQVQNTGWGGGASARGKDSTVERKEGGRGWETRSKRPA